MKTKRAHEFEFCSFVLVAFMILYPFGSRAADFLDNTKLQNLFWNRTVTGQTTKDKETWRASFTDDSTVTYVYSNGSIRTGTWRIQNNAIYLQFSNNVLCKRVFVDDGNLFHWKNCEDNATTSYLVNFRAGNSIANNTPQMSEQDKKRFLSMMRGFIGGLASNVPSDNPAGLMIQQAMGLIDPHISQYLSSEDQRFFESEIQQILRSGRDRETTSPSTGTRMGIRTLRNYADASGRQCKEYETPTTLPDGRQTTSTKRACVGNDGAYTPVE